MSQNYPRDVPPTRPNGGGQGAEVKGQQRTVGLGPDGRPVPGVDVQFTTAKGVQGSVFVPDSMFTVANVRAAVQAKAQVIDEVHGLVT